MGFYDATVMARDEYGERLRCLSLVSLCSLGLVPTRLHFSYVKSHAYMRANPPKQETPSYY